MAEKQSVLLLRKQLRDLNKNPVHGFSAGLVDDDIYKWSIMILGPEDSMYEGGIFKALLTFSDEYPIMPPKLKFKTSIWHPNIDENGKLRIIVRFIWLMWVMVYDYGCIYT